MRCESSIIWFKFPIQWLGFKRRKFQGHGFILLWPQFLLPILTAPRLDKAERQQALDELLPIQREDFVGIFCAMQGKPVTVRLIDPPLYEFLPNQIELEKEMAVLESKGLSDPEKSKLLSKVRELHEMNPMLGLRGVRLSIMFPSIALMQTAAIVGAAAQNKKEGIDVNPEIMIPLIGHVNELKAMRGDLERVAKEPAATEEQEEASGGGRNRA